MRFDLGHINKVTVIHIELTAGDPVYHFLTLKKAKTEIDFLKRGERILNLEDLIKEAGTNYPFLIHFTGKGILNRETVNQESYRQSVLLNANQDDFYFSDYIEGKKAFCSIVRKDTVATYINILKEKKGQVIAVSSGPFHAAILASVVQGQRDGNKKIEVGGIELDFENELLSGFQKKELGTAEQRSLTLGDERVSTALIPCAAAGAVFFNPNEKIVLPEDETIFTFNHEEAKQKNIFNRFGMGMMFFFLLLLFSNYLYLGHLNQKVIDNSVFLSAYDEQLNTIADLEEERVRKELLLQSSGLLNKNFLSFYLMELGNSAPKEIIFDEVILRPLKDEIKQRQKIAFEEHLVLVNGRVESSHVLSKWIEKIEQEEWLSTVDIIGYEYVKQQGVFELEMIVY